MTIELLHDQLHMILGWARNLSNHTRLLQRHTLRSGSSVANPARLRWKLAIDCVIQELRSRKTTPWTWFQTWVQAARYVAIRSLLWRHVHVSTFVDQAGQTQSRLYENLVPVSSKQWAARNLEYVVVKRKQSRDHDSIPLLLTVSTSWVGCL